MTTAHIEAYAIVLRAYYGGEACNEKGHSFLNHASENEDEDGACIEHNCPGQSLVLAIFPEEQHARNHLLTVASRICPKGWDYYNTHVKGIAMHPEQPDLDHDFVMLKDDCLYGSGLTIQKGDQETFEKRMALAKQYTRDNWPARIEEAEEPIDEAGCTLLCPWGEPDDKGRFYGPLGELMEEQS